MTGGTTMTELKTLKDLSILKRGRRREDTDRTGLYDMMIVGEYSTICFPDQLREEAIKWVKHIYNDARLEHRPLNDKDKHEIDWIKHFFNLTDEEIT